LLSISLRFAVTPHHILGCSYSGAAPGATTTSSRVGAPEDGIEVRIGEAFYCIVFEFRHFLAGNLLIVPALIVLKPEMRKAPTGACKCWV
jgi:hypothetical protein